MSDQFGFNFDQNFEVEPCEQDLPEKSVAVADPPETREAEQPPLFEGFAPVRKEEPEIPWTKYVRMVQMFFDGPKFEEFRGQISKLAVEYGTKNLTDTVAEAVRRAAN